MNTVDIQNIEAALSRHEKVALHVSGGRDSLATFHIMRPYLDRLTVYCLNTGDAFPEIIEVIESMKALCPNFVEMHGNQPAIIQQFGIPSDIVPANGTLIGVLANKGGQLIQDRYACCWRVLMEPVAARMVAEGVTLIIRGQKEVDEPKAPIRSGEIHDGIEYLFPIEHWTHQDVNDGLKSFGLPVPRFYQTLNKARDCMTCTGWWEDGRGAYLKEHYPAHYEIYQARLHAIQSQTAQHIANFNLEVES